MGFRLGAEVDQLDPQLCSDVDAAVVPIELAVVHPADPRVGNQLEAVHDLICSCLILPFPQVFEFISPLLFAFPNDTTLPYPGISAVTGRVGGMAPSRTHAFRRLIQLPPLFSGRE